MTNTAHCFLLFTAGCGSDADQRLCQAEAMMVETLEPAGGTIRLGDAWALCDSPDEPGCCEYTADLILELRVSGQMEELYRELADSLCSIGFKLCPPEVRPAAFQAALSLAA